MCAVGPAGWSTASMFASSLGSVLLLAPLGAFVWWATAVGNRRGPLGQTAAPMTSGPIEILRERFARGEIDVATFEEQVTHLLRTDRAPGQ